MVVQTDFFPRQTRLCALAQLKQDQSNRTVGFVAEQAEPFRFQPDGVSAGTQFCQPFRPVDKEKIAAVFQRLCGSCKQVVCAAAVFTPGIPQFGGGTALEVVKGAEPADPDVCTF